MSDEDLLLYGGDPGEPQGLLRPLPRPLPPSTMTRQRRRAEARATAKAPPGRKFGASGAWDRPRPQFDR